ncbi:MAG: OmpH family outer membrane protein [Janthinobacterium lividum]
MIIKHSRILLLIFFLVISTSQKVQATTSEEHNFEVKIAVVDVQLILENSTAIQSIKNSIDTITKDIQEYITLKETEFKKIEAELVKKQNIVSESVFKGEVDLFNAKVNETQKLIQGKKSRLEQAHSTAVAKVNEVTIEIINEFAKKYNFNVALPSSQVLFADVKLNITSEVITLLNSKLETVKINY